MAISVLFLDLNWHYNVDARTFNTEASYTEQSNQPPPKYSGNEVNIAVVEIIFPELLPDKKINPEINELSWKVFERLTDVLNANGALVTDNLPQTNKKRCRITGVDSCGDKINLTYEALKKRLEEGLLQAYQQNIPPQTDTFRD